MSDQPEQEIQPTSDPTAIKTATGESKGHLALLTSRILERVDAVVYAVVGICFILGALLALGYTFWSFFTSVNAILKVPADQTATQPAMFASTIISLVSDLLLVLIIMEVLSTVIEYLKSHVTTLIPFLSIGIISATRGILSIGARLSVGKEVQADEFSRSMIELAVNAFAILALGVTLYLITHHNKQTQL